MTAEKRRAGRRIRKARRAAAASRAAGRRISPSPLLLRAFENVLRRLRAQWQVIRATCAAAVEAIVRAFRFTEYVLGSPPVRRRQLIHNGRKPR